VAERSSSAKDSGAAPAEQLVFGRKVVRQPLAEQLEDLIAGGIAVFVVDLIDSIYNKTD